MYEHSNKIYSIICLIAAASAIAGVGCFNFHFVRIAAILVIGCIVDSWR